MVIHIGDREENEDYETMSMCLVRDRKLRREVLEKCMNQIPCNIYILSIYIVNDIYIYIIMMSFFLQQPSAASVNYHIQILIMQFHAIFLKLLPITWGPL